MPDPITCPLHGPLVQQIQALDKKLDQVLALLEPRDLEETIPGRCLALVGRTISLAKPMATPGVGLILAAAILVAVLSGTGLRLVTDLIEVAPGTVTTTTTPSSPDAPGSTTTTTTTTPEAVPMPDETSSVDTPIGLEP